MTRTIESEGEFKGWTTWDNEPFEYHVAGPFYRRTDDKGPVAAFRAEHKHMNAAGNMHGGCLMTFADYALFALAEDELDAYGLTIAFTSEFLAAAKEGDYIEARGEVMGGGRSILFVRGVVTANDRPVLNFSGTIKRSTLKPGS